MNIDTLITLGYYISSLGFLIAAIITGIAVSKFGKSALGSIFSYLFIGTCIFFIITIFQKLGGEFFGISAESMDMWWHIMFYMALLSYFFGFRALVGLGVDENTNSNVIGAEEKWGIFAVIVLIVIFIIPNWADPVTQVYSSSAIAGVGLHHFLSFILAAGVGYYLFNAKKNLGQIGQAIANPMIIGILALAGQHFWELLYESLKIVNVTSDTGEGIEKIFLIIFSVSIIYTSLRLKAFAK